MQINSLKHLLDRAHKPSAPKPIRTPASEKGKVVSIPTRAAVNRQAALVTRPNSCWLSRPLPPEKLPNPHQEELNRTKAELKIERNEHAVTRDALGSARQKLLAQRETIERQARTIASLQLEVDSNKKTIIRLQDHAHGLEDWAKTRLT